MILFNSYTKNKFRREPRCRWKRESRINRSHFNLIPLPKTKILVTKFDLSLARETSSLFSSYCSHLIIKRIIPLNHIKIIRVK
jgi:hypothetical protein